ncbi:hypothetical protein [Vibrio phage VP4B]|uniref:Uncharacterized protein n=1 Tax=Vibrio phage VP4B TaxID=1262540 RepID=V9M0R3_9CAUD|nr:hypothetical protein FDJ61_gp149 [Vibrio phage VP4B]AGB07263.1 hypothetical protein [Vibrio phage VP4B]
MSKSLKVEPTVQDKVLKELQSYATKIKTIRLNAEQEMAEWLNGLTPKEFSYLPESVGWEVLGGRRTILLPTTKAQLEWVNDFGLIAVKSKTQQELDLEELLKLHVLESYVIHGSMQTKTRMAIVAWSKGDYPYIFEAVRGKERMTVSIISPEVLDLDAEEFNKLYVNFAPVESEPYDRKELDERYEEGPTNSTDEMFEEVSNAVQEAAREQIEPVMGERCQLATMDNGRYGVELFREFPDREAAVAFMKAQLEL